jgi:hypothetical protein
VRCARSRTACCGKRGGSGWLRLRLVESTLLPLAQAGLEERSDRQDQQALAEQIAQISELLRQLDGRMRRKARERSNNGHTLAEKPPMEAAAAACAKPASDYTCARREPEKTALYQVLQNHLLTFEQEWTDQSEGRTLPSFVTGELRDFLGCGILARGLAQLFRPRGVREIIAAGHAASRR